MTYAIIENNKVVNKVVAEPEFAAQQGWVLLPDEADMGWIYENGQFSPPPRNIELEWFYVRRYRDKLLKDSDIYALSDRWENMSTQEKQSISNYRQQLRDIPQTYDDPADVVWPTAPFQTS